jgi:hypothetical protein
MAIVFISPKSKQRMFYVGIIMLLILFLIIISSIVFLPEFLNKNKSIPIKEILDKLDKSDVVINFNIMDSDKVKNLDPFDSQETEFTYVVFDQEGKQITGSISAVIKDDAQKLLEGAGFKVSSLKEMDIGREEPFVSY